MASSPNDAAGLAIIWISFTLALIFVILRLYVRWYRQKTASVSDGLILFAMIIFLYVSAANTANWHMGQWEISLADPEAISLALKKIPDRKKLVKILQLLYITGPCLYWGMWCVKAAVLLFYQNLITRAFKKLRIALHATTALCVVTFFVSEGLSLFWCFPVHRNWALDETFCTSFSAPPAYNFSVAAHLTTDLLIYILPFFVIPLLQLSTRKKFGVLFIFALGSLCLITSVIRIIVVGTSFSQWAVNSLGAVELSTAIMVACSPPLKWLYLKVKEEHSSRSRSKTGTKTDNFPAAIRKKNNYGDDYAEPDEPEWGTYNLAAMGVGRSAIMGSRGGSIRKKGERITDNDSTENILNLQTLVKVNSERVGGGGEEVTVVKPKPTAIRI